MPASSPASRPRRAPAVPCRGYAKHGNTENLLVLTLLASTDSSLKAPSSYPERR